MKLIILFCITIISLNCNAQHIIQDSNEQLPTDVKNYIENNMKGFDELSLIEACNTLTGRMLKFSTSSNIRHLNQLSIYKEVNANCVGYATVFKAVCTYAFKVNNRSCEVIHYRGPVKYKGLDITKTISSCLKYISKRAANFTKDHDYCVVITNKCRYKVDSSLSDVFM